MNDYISYRDQDMDFRYHTSEHPDQNHFRMHTHDHCELMYFLSEHAVFHIEGTGYPLQYGDLIITRPYEAHYIEIDPDRPYTRMIINFGDTLFNSLDPDRTLQRPFLDREPGRGNVYRMADFPTPVWQTYLAEMMKPAENHRIQILSNFLPLLNELQKAFNSMPKDQGNGSDPLSVQIISYINRNLSEDLSMEQLCSRFFISPAHLSRIFHRDAGAAPGEYISRKRLIHATNLLSSGTPPVVAASECGYNDYSAFYRAYKKHYGIAPSQASRRNARQTGENSTSP